MPALAEAIARYHRLVEQNGFGDPAWCEELQERMRRMHLTDSGRLLSPILRPYFLTAKQAETLARTAEHFSLILDRTQQLVLASPALQSRIQMLPAEKMLAALPSPSAHLSSACRLDSAFHKNNYSLLSLDGCQPAGLAYPALLADIFLHLPIVKEFARGGYKVSKLGAPGQLNAALMSAWREFKGKGKPAVAVVECALAAGSAASEGQLLTESLLSQGAAATLVAPEELRYRDGALHGPNGTIDLVFRRISVREILTRWELSHPLIQAYRDGAVCVVNSFRSEMSRRRALLELLSDASFVAHFAAPDRKLIRACVPWTRVVAQRQTQHGDAIVDLLPYIQQNRESLLLLPNEESSQDRVYIGAEMAGPAWERALRAALRTSYVVQESVPVPLESFPFFQYGEFKVTNTEIVLQTLLLGGKMAGASALLKQSSGGSSTTLGLAPVLVIS